MVVQVSVTAPLVSPAPSVYVGLALVVLGAKVPVPPVHLTPVAEPPIVEVSATEEPEQTVWLVPAVIVGPLTVMVTLLEAVIPQMSVIVQVYVVVADGAADTGFPEVGVKPVVGVQA